MDQRAFMEQVCECRDNSYLPSSKKIGSGAFSKVYLAYATQERTQHNSKLASDLRGIRATPQRGRPPPPHGVGDPWFTLQPSPEAPVLTPLRHFPGALAPSWSCILPEGQGSGRLITPSSWTP